MDLKILDYDGIVEYYGQDFVDIILPDYDSKVFNIYLQMILEGIINQDWQSIFFGCLGFNDANSMIHSDRLVHFTKALAYIIKEHRKYPRPSYPQISITVLELNESFNDEVKLQAMELFLPIIEQARLLKFELSKYLKLEVPENYLQKEMEQIRQLLENLKKEYQKQQSEFQKCDLVTKLDSPKDASCSIKCIIF